MSDCFIIYFAEDTGQSGNSFISLALDAIIEMFGPTALTRFNVARLAVIHVRSVNVVDMAVVQAKLQMVQSMGVQILLISSQPQSAEFNTLFSSSTVATYDNVANVACTLVRTRATLINSLRKSTYIFVFV